MIGSEGWSIKRTFSSSAAAGVSAAGSAAAEVSAGASVSLKKIVRCQIVLENEHKLTSPWLVQPEPRLLLPQWPQQQAHLWEPPQWQVQPG
jgi:hypothetical protein